MDFGLKLFNGRFAVYFFFCSITWCGIRFLFDQHLQIHNFEICMKEIDLYISGFPLYIAVFRQILDKNYAINQLIWAFLCYRLVWTHLFEMFPRKSVFFLSPSLFHSTSSYANVPENNKERRWRLNTKFHFSTSMLRK